MAAWVLTTGRFLFEFAWHPAHKLLYSAAPSMTGAAGGGALTGAGDGADATVEGDAVPSVETGTGAIVEPNADIGTGVAVEPSADTGTVLSVDVGAEPRFESGVVAGLEAVNRFAAWDDPAFSVSCSLSIAFLSDPALPCAPVFLPIFPCSDLRSDESDFTAPAPFQANTAVDIDAAQTSTARVVKMLFNCFM